MIELSVIAFNVVLFLLTTGFMAITSVCFVLPSRFIYYGNGVALAISSLICLWASAALFWEGEIEDIFIKGDFWISFVMPLFSFLPATVGYFMPLKVNSDQTWYCYLRPFSIMKETLEYDLENATEPMNASDGIRLEEIAVRLEEDVVRPEEEVIRPEEEVVRPEEEVVRPEENLIPTEENPIPTEENLIPQVALV